MNGPAEKPVHRASTARAIVGSGGGHPAVLRDRRANRDDSPLPAPTLPLWQDRLAADDPQESR